MSMFASDLLLDVALERSRKEKRAVSELLFEACCEKAQIGCKPIPTAQNVKTPDYELSIGGQTIIAEVKELKEDEAGGHHEIVGNRIRQKIRQCAPQLKARTAGRRHPGMLVLYRSGSSDLSYFYDPHLPAAMYGHYTLDLEVPRRGRPYAVGGQRFGSGKKMTPECNTSISAVGVIFRDWAADWDFDFCVFHNTYAAVPIEAGLLAQHGLRQFQMDFGRMQWVAVPEPDERKNCA